ncbi:hypothetical protein F5878DRAFT_373198 [Lentinula raphanica]|uniref:Uncharacterized protein n=1 Tax=Lentinula raphanica TaxID=153919 RepID=A0AA38P0Y3_9AGAR|nr:hypothetical protein F5878DRAFT_373198 [Lentinula raphanica]
MHESLSRELRAVFYNPRDIGYLYLEASFTRSGGISSLREVLREYSDLKLSSLTIVCETELSRCLTIPSSDAEPVFAPGQWVQIKRWTMMPFDSLTRTSVYVKCSYPQPVNHFICQMNNTNARSPSPIYLTIRNHPLTVIVPHRPDSPMTWRKRYYFAPRRNRQT